jgi:uncharacterized protein YuzE
MNFKYDKEHDNMTIIFTKETPKCSHVEAEQDGVCLLKDLETEKICGVLITNFSKQINTQDLFDIILEIPINTIQVKEKDQAILSNFLLMFNK